MVVPVGTPDYSTVTGSNQVFANSLSSGNLYLFTTTVNCFITQADSAPVASAGAGSILVPAGTTLLIHGKAGKLVAVIREAADGKATITPVRYAL